jgi:hypothetical protein
MTSQMVNCRKCGCECFWDTNRNGKRYLAQRNEREYDGGVGTWKSPHYCTATPEQAAEYQAGLKAQIDEETKLKLEALANGEKVVGQTVKVYRGRKVPQGTITRSASSQQMARSTLSHTTMLISTLMVLTNSTRSGSHKPKQKPKQVAQPVRHLLRQASKKSSKKSNTHEPHRVV